jgi:hypothetical protein
MAEEAIDWLFDYMLGVFKSPSWEVPVMEFIDANAHHFTPADENKLVYTDVHRQFCELVDRLLEEHLAVVGITAEEFVEVCMRARAKRNNDFNALVFEHLLAVDDFLTFKKLMCKRNAELEMETIRQVSNVGPSFPRCVPRPRARRVTRTPAYAGTGRLGGGGGRCVGGCSLRGVGARALPGRRRRVARRGSGRRHQRQHV